MAQFDPAAYASSVAALVGAPRLMALDEGEPNQSVFEQLTRSMRPDCSGGVRFATGTWRGRASPASGCPRFPRESHRISQGLHGREGSYWHGRCTGARATSERQVLVPPGRRPSDPRGAEAQSPGPASRRRRRRRAAALAERVGPVRLRRSVRGGLRRRQQWRAVPQDPAAGMAAAVRLLLPARARPALSAHRSPRPGSAFTKGLAMDAFMQAALREALAARAQGGHPFGRRWRAATGSSAPGTIAWSRAAIRPVTPRSRRSGTPGARRPMRHGDVRDRASLPDVRGRDRQAADPQGRGRRDLERRRVIGFHEIARRGGGRSEPAGVPAAAWSRPGEPLNKGTCQDGQRPIA